MPRGPEAKFWKRVREAWPGHAQRVEASDGEVDPGTPDSVLSIGYKGGWIELKVWPDELGREQLVWHEDAMQRGAYAMVLCELPDGSCWIGNFEEYKKLIDDYNHAWNRPLKRPPESRSLHEVLNVIACALSGRRIATKKR